MPRRTGIDTLFDNANVPSRRELLAMAEMQDEPIEAEPLDPEDYNQLTEGNPGDFGSDADDEDLEEEEYETAVGTAISNAENYIDLELSPDREIAARYYRAEPFGNEEDGRSQVVMSEVRDTVLAVMPALLRIFCGSTDAVEFINNEGTPEETAKNQTAYCNHIIHKDNEGFTIYHSAFKDALVRKTGIFTWWHEEREVVTRDVKTGLNEEAYALLQTEVAESSSEDENIKFDIQVTDEREDTTAPGEMPIQLGEEDPTAAAPVQNYIRDVVVLRRAIVKRHKVAAVPPEEFICTPIASSDLDEFPLVGRRMMRTIGDLVAIGHDEEEIREALGGNGGSNDQLGYNSERVDRNGQALDRIFDTGFEAVDEASEYVKYCEVYILIDKDGDGIIERRKVCTVGDNHKIIYDEIVDDMVPFALICPDPEPHSPFGYSLADQTMDFQEMKSEMIRGVLDSLAESIVGRTAILEGKVNIDDALSNERSQLIRIKEIGAIQDLSKPFVGANAIPVFQYLDDVKARRTGITMSPAGLAADTLQSTATDAVQATVDASQERTEMIARIFAETGIKRLFRGLLRNVVKHQDRKRSIRLRGKAVTVDPRTFVVDLDLDTNVGLGKGTGAKKVQGLMMILSQQKEVYQTMGPTNPWVGAHHITHTMEDFIREIGFNDVGRYMNVLSKDDNDRIVENARNAPEKPTPEELLHQASMAKIQSDAEAKRRSDMIKMTIEMMKMEGKNNLDDQNFYLRAAEILGKFGIEVDKADLEKERLDHQAADAELNAQNQQAQLEAKTNAAV